MKINDNLQFYLMYFVLLLSTCKRQIIMILFFTSSMLNTKSSSGTFSFILYTVEYTSIHLLSVRKCIFSFYRSKNCFAYHFQLTPHRRLKLRSDTVSCYLAVSRKSSAQHFTNYLQHFQSKT